MVLDGTSADRPAFIIATRTTTDQIGEGFDIPGNDMGIRSHDLARLPSLFDLRQILTDVLIVIFR